MDSERQVLRVFIASTPSDMTACRERVSTTILRPGHFPGSGLKTFTPQPTTPVADCTRESAAADAIIVMVAYRYGSPPATDMGGDGKRSVTWLEVEAAKQAGKPVYAYLIDPTAQWNQPKESDLLNTEPKEKHVEILARIQGMKEFKEYLNEHCTWALFSSADNLAAMVATTLARHMKKVSPPDRPAAPAVTDESPIVPRAKIIQRRRLSLLSEAIAGGTRSRLAGKRCLLERQAGRARPGEDLQSWPASWSQRLWQVVVDEGWRAAASWTPRTRDLCRSLTRRHREAGARQVEDAVPRTARQGLARHGLAGRARNSAR